MRAQNRRLHDAGTGPLVAGALLVMLFTAGVLPVRAHAAALTGVVDMAAGPRHSAAVKSDGTLWAWGDARYSPSGQSSPPLRLLPVQIGTGKRWARVSAGGSRTYAIQTDGSLWGWGYNAGALGDGTEITRTTPVRIGADYNWRDVFGGPGHTLAIKTDGTLWVWGSIYERYLTPVQVGSASDWAAASPGLFHTVAIKTDGTLWSWGTNEYGQLGDGTTTTRFTPVRVGSAADWASVSAGYEHTVALKRDGSLWAWGINGNGNLGDGTRTNRNYPVRIGLANDWVTASAGAGHSVGSKSNGSVWAWGDPRQLGFSAGNQFNTPTRMNPGPGFVAATAGMNHNLALTVDGTLGAWGGNPNGELGDGATYYSPPPFVIVQVGGGALTGSWANPYAVPPDFPQGGGAARPVVVFLAGFTSDSSDGTWAMLSSELRSAGYGIVEVPTSRWASSPTVVDSVGSLSMNKRRLSAYLASQGGLRGRDVVFVAHSMGGLITRGFCDDETLVQQSGVRPVAIIQLATPNSGSPLTAWRFLLSPTQDAVLDAVAPAASDLSPDHMAEWNASNTNNNRRVPIYRIGGDYFPSAAAAHAVSGSASRYAVESLWLAFNVATFGGSANDGAVSDHSLAGPSALVGLQGSPVWLPVRHAAICYPGGWDEIGTVVPQSGRDPSTAQAISRQVALWLRRIPSRASGVRALSSVRLSYSAVQTAPALPADGWHDLPDRSSMIASGSTARLSFSLEGTSAVLLVSSAGGTPALSLVGPEGPVEVVRAPWGSGGVAYLVPATAPGVHEATAWIEDSGSGEVVLSVVDGGSAELSVSAPHDVLASTQAVVTAEVDSDGGVVNSLDATASVSGSGAVRMRDDGIAPDQNAGDGIFTASLMLPPTAGIADVVVEARGTDTVGRAFEREGHVLVSVSEPVGALAGTYALRPTLLPSGKLSGAVLDVGIRGAQDATVAVYADIVDDSGLLVAQPKTAVRVSRQTDTTATLGIPSDLLYDNLSTGSSLRVARVSLRQLTDEIDAQIDSATDVAVSNPVAKSDLAVARTTMDTPASDSTSSSVITLTGSALCTTETISGVDVSLDGGLTWDSALPSDGAFDSGNEAYTISYEAPEGEVGALVRSVGAQSGVLGERRGVILLIDRTPPRSSHSGIPGGWVNGDVTMSLGATDSSGSGVAETFYRVGLGAAEAYTAPVLFSGDTSASVEYWSVDQAGNRESASTAIVRIDKTAPVTTHDGRVSYSSAATITLLPADAGSGVAETLFKLDDGPWVSGCVVTASTMGTHTLEFYSVDVAGNEESPRGQLTFRVEDGLPPDTWDDAPAGWVSGDVNLTLSAIDVGTGVSAIAWARTGPTGGVTTGATNAQTAQILVTDEGTTTVRFCATDIAGNTSATRAAVVRIDKTPPLGWAEPPTAVDTPFDQGGSVSLSWTPAVDNTGVSGYVLYRGIAPGVDTRIVVLPNTTSYLDQAVTPGDTFCYQVAAVDLAGNEGPRSPEAYATAIDNLPPSVPQGLSAVAGASSVDLEWAANTEPDLERYRVYRSTVSGVGYELVGTLQAVGAGTMRLSDMGVTSNQTYFYVVTAVDASGNESGPSNEAQVLPDNTPPTTPVGLVAVATSVSSITLTWTASMDSGGVESYAVQRSLNGTSGWQDISVVSTPQCVDVGLLPATRYYYRVSAVDVAGNASGYSTTIQQTTQADTTPPTVPVGLSPVVLGATQILLTWSPSTDDVAVREYRIERSTNGSTFTAVGAAPTTSFAATGLVANTKYYFRVRAADAAGNLSAYTASVTATTARFVRAEEAATAIYYSGTWTTMNSSSCSGGRQKTSISAGSAASFTFTGTDVVWIGAKGTNYGVARVYLDGVLQGTVDCYASKSGYKVALFTKGGLARATHVLRIEVAGTRNPASKGYLIAVDAFDSAN
jgi:alpha-tubulin suppressor-like RCC1 family protein/fibronectin type 3 domain-containing protein